MTPHEVYEKWKSELPLECRTAFNNDLISLAAAVAERGIPEGWRLVPIKATIGMHNAPAFGPGGWQPAKIEATADGFLRVIDNCPDWSKIWDMMIAQAPKPQVMPDASIAPKAPYVFDAYSVGVCYASVCTSLSDLEATNHLNAAHPTGTEYPWQIADEAFKTGELNGCACEDYPATHRHLLFHC